MEKQLQPKSHSIAILAEGSFGILESKTATVLVRYLPDNVVAVIDSANAGRDVSEVIEIGEGIPDCQRSRCGDAIQSDDACYWYCTTRW